MLKRVAASIKNALLGVWRQSGTILNILKYGGLILAVLVVLILVFDRVLMPLYTRHGSEFPLPNLVGKAYDEATQIAEKLAFEVIIQGKQPSPGLAEGTIISQIPSAGTAIKEKRQVKVIVSSGEEMVEVPDLSRLSVRQAELKLPEYGLTVRNYHSTTSDTLANDVIAFTIPPAGALVPKNTGVDLFINRNSRTPEIYMPKLVGKSIEQAKRILDSLGFLEPRIEYVTNPLLLPKIVTHQEPPTGSKVIADSTQVVLIAPVGK